MSDAVYILGTDEYVAWEIECTTPGFTYTPSEWTAAATMVELGTPFVDTPSVFTVAALSTTDGKHYGKARLADLGGTTAGKYRILTRLTKTQGGVEIPLLRARGVVTVEAG